MDEKIILLGLAVLLLKDSNLKNEKDNKFRGIINLDDDAMERSIELLSRSKKYLDKEERILLGKAENILELVHRIRKLNNIEQDEESVDKIEFFRSMDKKDKKNMMIKEMIEVFPKETKDTLSKALDMREKISLLKSLIQSDDGEGLLSSKNLGNMKMLGQFLGNSSEE
ncbi:hypothetical protein SAMN05661008_00243 [Alkalithermobacter thermoalcaliphilus JW-YL-7 = DSM 7308]|uniref:Uncharacterized protein n=1 Tax=Alkalithermobacter thermoalcaliphilus JW-YL-7 = DSM 7308 TaxID=1121328 RepID=A0A150FRH1_CLOPD|nr:hypothetical protein JWYL7_1279 [[Clostridium] paradoxum JW-YL-7 = DSM 7308]SHK42701.1 hypothetical protein SAMN05661008_00243 [[Clostridium] paradoxum JW-YL-7 = DSM 7308]